MGNCVIDEDSVESHFEKLKENDCCDQSRLADKVKLVEKRINLNKLYTLIRIGFEPN